VPFVARFTVAVCSGVSPSVNTIDVLAFSVNVAGVSLFTITVQVYVPFACSAGDPHVLVDD